MFSSRTIVEHLVRGAIGFGAVIAVVLMTRHFGPVQLLVSLALLGVALFAWRGCPMCWAMGLVDTVMEPRSRARRGGRRSRNPPGG